MKRLKYTSAVPVREEEKGQRLEFFSPVDGMRVFMCTYNAIRETHPRVELLTRRL